MSFISELKRRNVLRAAIGYLTGAWLLIQILETLFPIFGLPETSIRIVVVLLAIGLPPVLVLSWTYEWTPEGLQRDDGVITEADAIARRRLDRIIFVVLVLALSYFAVDKFVLDPARDARQEQAAEDRGRTAAFIESYGDKSIAVLPFADLSAGADQAHFSDGIAEEVLNLLARVSELRVISRSSAFKYRGDDVHIPAVAEELNVSYVLEGSVRKAGDRIRITAQLIDARADAHLWSETYDREFGDVFAIQDDIARSIVDELEITLLGDGPKVERTDPETYALYLQAHHAMYVLQDYSEATEQLLEQVLERDPNYVPALTTMVHVTSALTGDAPYSKYSWEEGIPLMRRYVDRALAIDPQDGRANAHRGWMALFYQKDLETAVRYLNRALEYDPHDELTLFYAGTVSGYLGRHEDAITLLNAALARDPLCNPCLYVVMQNYFRSGRLDEALAASERRMRIASGGWISRGNIHLFKGEVQEALESYDRQQEPRFAWLGARAIALYELGDEAGYRGALEELESIDNADAFLEAGRLHAWAGNIDTAFEHLDRSLDPDSPDFFWLATRVVWNPFFRNLHDDPRWLALREEAGLGPERLAAIRIVPPDSDAAGHR
jgi:adenylate cyclase